MLDWKERRAGNTLWEKVWVVWAQLVAGSTQTVKGDKEETVAMGKRIYCGYSHSFDCLCLCIYP